MDAMTLVHIVASNLRALRSQQRLSQAEVAARAKLSVSYISMLERGERTPPLDTLETLARVLKVSPGYLLQQNETPRARRAR